MQKLTQEQIEVIKNQIDDSISTGCMNLKVGIVLKETLNQALSIANVVGQSEQLPNKYCPQCGEPVAQKHKFWCKEKS